MSAHRCLLQVLGQIDEAEEAVVEMIAIGRMNDCAVARGLRDLRELYALRRSILQSASVAPHRAEARA